ncbi:unnamed protein product [Cyclocybe aegerita]|uniref:Uncharacterized protein n=1 Tax=Cyclocybe aegerita TaxID=1973307 RepID=A0A8S0VRL7_CYCAE|nr:unnamed protein product [Cyclocybe aegerita]
MIIMSCVASSCSFPSSSIIFTRFLLRSLFIHCRMSTKFKPKTLADESDDEDALSMLDSLNSTQEQPEWIRDKNGDLDWAYTARCARTWSHDALLTHLCQQSFSIPPRDYNPSAPFVYARMLDGEVVTLPHGYRLPLMFVGKYIWETMFSKLKDETTWKKERANLFHLSRLCQNLFRRARAKALKGGMEKGWRSLMFDRLLARFYKHWTTNDPKSGPKFITTHSIKEYDRDVLKHDWRRWCLRGLGSVRMTEDEVNNGITHEEFRKTLGKNEHGDWMLNGKHLTFVTTEEGEAWISTSELTEEEDEDEGEKGEDQGNEEESEEDEEEVMEVIHVGKRRRDEEQPDRSPKRSKLAGLHQPKMINTLAAIKQRLEMPRSSPPRQEGTSASAPVASTSQQPLIQPKIEYAPISISSIDDVPRTSPATTPTVAIATPSTTVKAKRPPREPTRTSARNVARPFLGLPNPLARTARSKQPVKIGPPPKKAAPAQKTIEQTSSSSSSSSEEEEDKSDDDKPSGEVTSKALELLVKLLNAKKALENDAQPSSAAGPSTRGSGKILVPASSSLASGSDQRVVESQLLKFEGRFLSMKEELLGIVGRLQALENDDLRYRQLDRNGNDRVLVDTGVDCTPARVTQEIQTDAEDVEMGDEWLGGKVTFYPVRLFRETGMQTVVEEKRPSPAPRLTLGNPQVSTGLSATPFVQALDQALDHDSPCVGSTSAQTDSTLAPSASYDPRTDLMRSNLLDVVENLVSAKMLALTQGMVKAKQNGGSISGTETPNALASPTLGGHASQPFVINTLMDEIKSMREETRVREQRDKEEMEAMRQLHSAEVDALRRRLSYLESQHRHGESSSSSATRYRSSSAHSLHFDSGSSHLSAPVLGEPVENGRLSRQRYHQPNGRFSPSYSGPGDSADTSSSHAFSPLLRTTNPGDAPESGGAMPTPTPSERSYSFTRPGLDIDEDMPLPIKSQRKQHIMALARAHLG